MRGWQCHVVAFNPNQGTSAVPDVIRLDGQSVKAESALQINQQISIGCPCGVTASTNHLFRDILLKAI